MNKKHSKTMVILAFLGMKNDMKRLAVFSVFVLFCQVLDATNPYSANTNKSEGAVSFVVDENLPTPEYNLNHSCVTEIWGALLSRCQVSNKDLNILSCNCEEDSLCGMTEDAFFRCVVKAYADHRPLILSPDVVWMVICQGFTRYLKAHQDQLRSQIVDHDGKIDLVVQSEFDLLSDKADWSGLMAGFVSNIRNHTKEDVADVLFANFSTTGSIEKIASGVMLMEAMDSFFNYKSFYVACGIPSITLKGTPDDWRWILEKIDYFKKYGMGKWVNSLKPILTEFVKAAEGNPKKSFWQDIVNKRTINNLEGGICNPKESTRINGWLLKFFPDKNGRTRKKAAFTSSMPSEIGHVELIYKVLDPLTGNVISETPLEIWAGIIGYHEDMDTYALTPCIGWMVRKAVHSDEEEEFIF